MSDSPDIYKLYDDACKRFLCEKSILAWVLKYSTKEFTNLSTDYIANKYIEGEPTIGADNEDHATKPAPIITGMSNEEPSLENVATKYDIKLVAVNPVNNGKSAIIINLDAQSNFYPGYSIVTRGVCYGAFMIAAQYGTVFTGDNYDNVNKVYSIWLCTNPPVNRHNTITCYEISERNLIGNVHEKRSKYDLLTVVMICTAEDNSQTDNPLLKLLSLIFNHGHSVKELETKLSTEYGINVTPDLKERMINMCNLSYGVDQRGYNRGYNSGFSDGVNKERIRSAKAMIAAGITTLDQIANTNLYSKDELAAIAVLSEKQ